MTIPNALSLLRALLIPFFISAANHGHDLLALILLMVASATDYLDGKVARWLKQESQLGAVLDPSIDRLYIAASLYILWNRSIFPIWLVEILLIRDLALLVLNVRMKQKGLPLLKVNFLGKAATFNLLYAFPLLFLSLHAGLVGQISFVVGWSFAVWGIALYLLTGFGYLVSGFKGIRFAPSTE